MINKEDLKIVCCVEADPAITYICIQCPECMSACAFLCTSRAK